MARLLDTHQHLVYPEVLGYGWTDGVPALEGKSFTLADYRALTSGAVGGTLFMETGVDDKDYQKETRFVAETMARGETPILGIIASCRPEEEAGFDAWLEECTALPVCGFRRILHVVDDEMSRSESFRDHVRAIGRRDRTFDMCFLARQLPIALELATACDNTRLVLDHCGVPDIAGGDIETWRGHISALAGLPHVSCKLSGVLAYCAPGEAGMEAVRPYLDHVVASFGTDRVVWGSDWPVVNMTSDLPAWIAGFEAFLDGFSENEAAAIAHGNAERIYKVRMPA